MQIMKRTLAMLAMTSLALTGANAQQTDYKPMDDENKVVDLTTGRTGYVASAYVSRI